MSILTVNYSSLINAVLTVSYIGVTDKVIEKDSNELNVPVNSDITFKIHRFS